MWFRNLFNCPCLHAKYNSVLLRIGSESVSDPATDMVTPRREDRRAESSRVVEVSVE
jgi:hypothetical protein